MKLIVPLLLLISLSTYSQSKNTETIFKTLSSGELMKQTIKVAGYDVDKVTDFSNALARYKDKIYNVEFNTNTNIVKFTYNEFMLKKDLIKTFHKYGINYRPEKISAVKTAN